MDNTFLNHNHKQIVQIIFYIKYSRYDINNITSNCKQKDQKVHKTHPFLQQNSHKKKNQQEWQEITLAASTVRY